jgi:hypothetical protein
MCQDGVIDCNIDIAIFYCDSTCAAAEETYWDVVKCQKILYSLEGNNSSIMV